MGDIRDDLCSVYVSVVRRDGTLLTETDIALVTTAIMGDTGLFVGKRIGKSVQVMHSILRLLTIDKPVGQKRSCTCFYMGIQQPTDRSELYSTC